MNNSSVLPNNLTKLTNKSLNTVNFSTDDISEIINNLNVVLVHKKGDKQRLKNYRPISLLPICSKIFERLIYNKLFTFFTDNNLISPNQSGFRPGDSCFNQLIAIFHEIYKSFDDGLEVRGVFLDISKAFDKVWDEGLLLKLSLNGISRNLLKLLRDFLYCHK